MDHIASGIGSVAGPLLATWRARREAEARRILASGEADIMRTITAAQAEARELMTSPDANLRMEVDISQSVEQRMQFQEEKRQRNIVSVVQKAADELVGREVDDSPTDYDWTARFFNYVQDISSEDMQLLWAKVLAGEVERSGATSVMTLSILRNLDRSAANLFSTLSSLCISLRVNDNQFLDARVCSLGGNASSNSLISYGLSYDNLNVLNEHGLITPEYNSWSDYSICIGSVLPGTRPTVVRVPFVFQNRFWELVPTDSRTPGQEFRLQGVALTRAGRELSLVA